MSTPDNAARARAALAAKRAQEKAHPEAEPIVAFAVMRMADGLYRPMRITLTPASAFEAVPLHEPMPYEALAYHYLANDVTAHYEAGTRSKARECAALSRAAGPVDPVGHG